MNVFGQLKSAFFEILAAVPSFSASEKGRIVFDDSTKTPKYNDGTEWLEMSSAGGGGLTAIEAPIANNQTILADVAGFFVDSALYKGFDADILISRTESLALAEYDPKFDFNISSGGAYQPIINACIEYRNKILISGHRVLQDPSTLDYYKGLGLNKDGSIDTSFDFSKLTLGVNDHIRHTIKTSDGKLIIIHNGPSSFSNTVAGIVKVDENFDEDTAFSTIAGTGIVFESNTRPNAIQLPTGEILLTGVASYNGTAVQDILKIDEDGNLDTAFVTNLGTGSVAGSIYCIDQDSNGNIYIGGNFSSWNGSIYDKLVKLFPTGVQDTAFSVATGVITGGDIWSMAIRSDDNILAFGNTGVNISGTVGAVHKVSPLGVLDAAYHDAFDGTVVHAYRNPVDESMVILGSFTTAESGALTRQKIMFVDAAGFDRPALYATFANGVGIGTTTPNTGAEDVKPPCIYNDNRFFYCGEYLGPQTGGLLSDAINVVNINGVEKEVIREANFKGYLHNSGKWSLSEAVFIGDEVGLEFDMLDSGQLKYKSSNLVDSLDADFMRFIIKAL